MVAEPGFGSAPVSHRVTVQFFAAFQLCLIPVHFERRIALEIKRLAIGLSKSRIKNELRSPARVAHALSLHQRHVVAYTMFRLACSETLQECRSAVLEAIKNCSIQFRRVRD